MYGTALFDPEKRRPVSAGDADSEAAAWREDMRG